MNHTQRFHKMPKHKYVKVTLSDDNGAVLDSFVVCHYRNSVDAGDMEEENVGSNASDGLLVHRIKQYVCGAEEAPKP